MAAARIALTSTGPAPQTGPVATAHTPTDCPRMPSAFEALLTNEQQRVWPEDGANPQQESDLPPQAGLERPPAADLPPGAAMAAQAAWLATEHFESAGTHAVRRGAIRGRGVTDASDDAPADAGCTDDSTPDAVAMLLVSVITPAAIPPQAMDAWPATFDLSSPSSVAAAPAGRWRGGQVPDGIVLPPPVPADVGPEAEAVSSDRTGTASVTVLDDGAADAGPAVAPSAATPTGRPPAMGDASEVRGGLEHRPPAEARPEHASRPHATAEAPRADQRTGLSSVVPAATAPGRPHEPPAGQPPAPRPDGPDSAIVMREDASAARSTDGASTGAPPDRDARGSDPARPRGVERAVETAGQRPAIVTTLLATEPPARAAIASQGAGAHPSGPLPDDDSIASQIVQRMRLQWIGGGGTAVVTLDPEYLGAVTINLQVDGSGAVTATVSADNADVRAWMHAHEPALRLQLAEQGLSLDRLQVTDEHPRGDETPADERRRRWQPPAPPQPKRTASGTFAVVV